MNSIRKWMNWLLRKKPVVKVKEQYLFSGVKTEIPRKENIATFVDEASVILTRLNEVIGVGVAILSGIRTNENDYIFSEISDLEIKDGYNLLEDDTLQVQFSTIGYDFSSKAVTHDAYITFENVQLLNGNEITCHKSNVKTVILGREEVEI